MKNSLARSRYRARFFRSFLSPLFFVTLPVYAQVPVPDQSTEITVHGANFEAPLAKVPDSVSVLDADDIERGAARNISDLLLAVPDLNAAGGSSRPRFFQIRGIGELEQYEGAPNTSVGFVLDGVDLSGLASNVSLWDINQIEVFRGPQATRFGSSALAGVVNMQSTEASSLSEGRVQLGGGVR